MLLDLSRPGLPDAPGVLRLVDSAQMRAVERAANAQGHDYATMMDLAGAAVARVVGERLRPSNGTARTAGSIVVLVGPGNNGGDGLVAAMGLARDGYPVKVVLWRRAADDALLGRAIAAGLEPTDGDLGSPGAVAGVLRQAAVIVDALLGTGVSRPLGPDIAGLLDAVRAETERREAVDRARGGPGESGSAGARSAEAAEIGPLFIVAVDVPSGLNVDTGSADPHTLEADVTVTFGLAKAGQFQFPGAGLCGRLLLDDIGIAADAAEEATTGEGRVMTLMTRSGARALLPRREPSGHKGSFGKVLVVAGSASYAGAAYLAGLGAYRAGAGLVTIALPRSIHPIVASRLPEATFVRLPDEAGSGGLGPAAAPIVKSLWRGYDAVVVGPGLGTAAPTADFMAALLTRDAAGTVPQLIVDADGLNLLAGRTDGLRGLRAGTIITPHPGEMGRLTGQSAGEVNVDRIGVARRVAADSGTIVVLKGAYSVVAEPGGRATVNPFASPLLATAGSGDVLAGTMAGLVAQGAVAADAAALGTYLHAYAATLLPDAAAERGLLAHEIADGLPRAIAQVDALVDLLSSG